MRGQGVLRQAIARHRRSWIVERAHRLARFVEDAYDNVGSDIASTGELALLRRFAPARFATLIDAGANNGDWSIQALTLWPLARVHAFEVAPQTYGLLEARIAARQLTGRATLNLRGLGNSSDRRQMFYFPDHPDLTCDMPRHDNPRAIPFEAEFVAGDDYLSQQGLQDIDLLKIDVEGAEHLVLEGFSRSIAAGRIQAIQFEYGAFSIQTRVLLADHYERLSPYYWIGKVFPEHVEFRDYHWTMEDFRFANFLCVSRSRGDLRALAEG